MGNCYCLKNSSSQNASGLKTVFDLEDYNNQEANALKGTYQEYENNAKNKGDLSFINLTKAIDSQIGTNENVNHNTHGIDSYNDKKKQLPQPVNSEKNKENKNNSTEKLEDTSDKLNNIDNITSLNIENQLQQQLNGMHKINKYEYEKANNNKSNCNFNDNMNGNYNINDKNTNNNSEMITKTNSIIENPTLNKRLTEILKLKDISKNLRDKGNSINVVLLGDKCVGKTSIVYQFISNKFDQYYIQTIIKEEFSKVIQVNGKKYNINFTVTSGVREYQEDYTNLYKICDFFVVCYDVTNSASFEKAREIITNEILPYVFLYNDGCANIVLVGNKCDLKERAVDQQKVREYCEKHTIDFYETSAKLKSNIAKIFNRIVDVYDEAVSGIAE